MESDVHGSLAEDLADLALELDDGRHDLRNGLGALWRDYHLAVPSALGFSITVKTSIHPALIITQAVDLIQPHDVGSTLSASMGHLDQLDAEWSITYYAGEPGALHPFSADLALAMGQPASAHVVDRDRPGAVIDPGIAGLEAFSMINRALGVLVARGCSHGEARDQFTPGDPASNLTKAEELISSGRPRDG